MNTLSICIVILVDYRPHPPVHGFGFRNQIGRTILDPQILVFVKRVMEYFPCNKGVIVHHPRQDNHHIHLQPFLMNRWIVIINLFFQGRYGIHSNGATFGRHANAAGASHDGILVKDPAFLFCFIFRALLDQQGSVGGHLWKGGFRTFDAVQYRCRMHKFVFMGPLHIVVVCVCMCVYVCVCVWETLWFFLLWVWGRIVACLCFKMNVCFISGPGPSGCRRLQQGKPVPTRPRAVQGKAYMEVRPH